MQDRPTAAELANAVRDFLEQEVLPEFSDARLRFRMLVACNALEVLERELTSGERLCMEEARALSSALGEPWGTLQDSVPQGEVGARAHELRARLAARIRGGDAPVDAIRVLKESVRRKLAVASPRYLSPDRGRSPKPRAAGGDVEQPNK